MSGNAFRWLTSSGLAVTCGGRKRLVGAGFGMALRDQGVDLVSWNAEGTKEAGDVGVGVRRRIDG